MPELDPPMVDLKAAKPVETHVAYERIVRGLAFVARSRELGDGQFQALPHFLGCRALWWRVRQQPFVGCVRKS